MSVANAVLGPLIWGVPNEEGNVIELLRREIYCKLNAGKLRLFFFGMLARDDKCSEEERIGYYSWLQQLAWPKLLGGLPLVAGWQRNAKQASDPIGITVRQEYERLFNCFKMGKNPRQPDIV